ncbi:short chain dehydrogenase [Lophiotrema nucula]|uniref:Short chain dehydrogenase n=1 Tax=Lophiotrema nucula TaxID=690887 RepID=A0A6A5ZB20_9PLEO|nr:short chain dehydrogenase [Lophiotrema nucula]
MDVVKMSNVKDKTVFIVGGSTGLGKEIAKELASQGAHITIFGRNQKRLDEATIEIDTAKQSENQVITAVSADMSDATTVRAVFASQPRLPDILICNAGGTSTELGFLIDLEPDVFERCMKNNYYTSLYPARAVLKAWVEDDRDSKALAKPKERKIVFVNSTASLCPAPGYLAYNATKSAQRALAETLRLEATRYNNPKSTYKVQCVFAHNFISDTFLIEQQNKPSLTKRLENTEGDLKMLEKKFPYAEKIAPEIVDAVAKGDYAVLDGRFESQIVWGVGMGGSPKRCWGVWDVLLALLAMFAWPFERRRWGFEK